MLLKKAIYGTLNAAILAYRKLTGHLADWGFEMNSYDPCVWNLMVNGTQPTVVFHVDNGLISHVDPTVVTGTLRNLYDVYGKTDPLAIQRGKQYEYMGMTIDFFQPNGDVMISMYDCVNKLIDKLPEYMI